MKTLSAPVLAALASGSVAIATLIKLDFAGTPVYLNTSTWNLVWQRRYNLLLRSQELEHSVWTRDGVSVTNNAATAPDGTTTAEKLFLSATTNLHIQYQLASVTAGQPYTFSVYAKTVETALIALYVPDATYGPRGASFHVTDGTVYATTGDAAPKIVSVGGGWYRCSITLAPSTTDVYSFGLGIGSIVGYPSTPFLGDGSAGLYVWGAQLEPGDLASTYTATTTAALTEAGETYLGAYGLGQISAIADKPGEAAGITLELHGADAARISLALDDSDIVQGTPCTIRTAIIDTATYTILDAPIEWVGKLDTMAIGEDGTSATIAVTAESGAVDLLRGNAWTFTDADQRIVNATDASFSYVLDQIDKPIVWPTRAYFYK